MCVMMRLIRVECVQTLVRRNKAESSYELKHIKVNLVPVKERINVPVRAESWVWPTDRTASRERDEIWSVKTAE